MFPISSTRSRRELQGQRRPSRWSSARARCRTAGACILWLNEQGTATPAIFGSVKVEGTTATLVADLKDEPSSVAQALSAASSFDLTSCWYDPSSGVYEEFYFATVAMADIPVTR